MLLTVLIANSIIINAQTAIQEFTFNASILNTATTITFIGSPTYVSDRFGIADRALYLANTDVEAVINDLPQNNAARTVALWVKFNDVAEANYIWGYGTAYNAQYFGLIHQAAFNTNSNLSLAGWGPSNDIIASTSLAADLWYNYVVTFDGTTSNIYRNGELITSKKTIERFTKGTVFRLGKINSTVGINAAIDDLKIFDVALTSEQVSQMYLNEKSSVILPKQVVAKSKAAAKVPVKTAVTVKKSSTTIGTELISTNQKAIEIFSQGQKVLGSTNQAVNISDLPDGTYLLKISRVASKTVTSN